MGTHLSQLLEVGEVLRVVSGSGSGFFGLVCPAHCGHPTALSLLITFLAGLTCGNH